jgi:hypothetical protein
LKDPIAHNKRNDQNKNNNYNYEDVVENVAEICQVCDLKAPEITQACALLFKPHGFFVALADTGLCIVGT